MCVAMAAVALSLATDSLAGEPVAGQTGGPVATTLPATRPAASQPHVVQFQPGIRINWTQRQVEADFTVVLREGAIEVFACCPRQREYESIVRMEARPTHLYQAMGLIGLTPGHPERLDDQGNFVPATGDPVDVGVRYERVGVTRREPIEAWMEPAEGHASLGRLPWVFAGSIPLEDGKHLAADVEGTVVAVVDFPTSLIALPEHHTDRNEELWLRPRTAQIPPVGTKGQLIIRAAPLRLRLEAGGRLRSGERTITRDELARTVAERLAGNADLRVEVTIASGTEAFEKKSLVQMLRGLKVREQAIEMLTNSGEK
jgi:hypothetical protein